MSNSIIRSILGIIFPTFLIVIIFTLFLLTYLDYLSWKETKEAIEIIGPVVTGYIGSIIGYYFSKRN